MLNLTKIKATLTQLSADLKKKTNTFDKILTILEAAMPLFN